MSFGSLLSSIIFRISELPGASSPGPIPRLCLRRRSLDAALLAQHVIEMDVIHVLSKNKGTLLN